MRARDDISFNLYSCMCCWFTEYIKDILFKKYTDVQKLLNVKAFAHARGDICINLSMPNVMCRSCLLHMNLVKTQLIVKPFARIWLRNAIFFFAVLLINGI